MSKFNINKLQNILIQFRMPFPIDVLNSIDKKDKGTPYAISINSIPAELRFERIYDFKYKSDGADMAPYSKIEEDRGGILSTVKVQILFDTKILKKINVEKDKLRFESSTFIDFALEYINKFLIAYRDISNQFWIRKIVRKDIFNYDYVLFDEKKEKRVSHTLIPQHSSVRFNGNKNFQLENNKDQILREMIQTDYFSFRNELILDSENNFNLGNYNIALLQAVMRFENFVYSNIRKKVSNRKFLLHTRKKNCKCLIGVTGICTNGFKELFKVDFEDTVEYKNLNNKALKIRNKIVHGKITKSITREESAEGIDAVAYAEKYLIENVFTDLQSS